MGKKVPKILIRGAYTASLSQASKQASMTCLDAASRTAWRQAVRLGPASRRSAIASGSGSSSRPQLLPLTPPSRLQQHRYQQQRCLSLASSSARSNAMPSQRRPAPAALFPTLSRPQIARVQQVRQSHIGAAPVFVPPSVHLSILPVPPVVRRSSRAPTTAAASPTSSSSSGSGQAAPSAEEQRKNLSPTVARAQTLLVEGPLGRCYVPLFESVRLHWGEAGAALAAAARKAKNTKVASGGKRAAATAARAGALALSQSPSAAASKAAELLAGRAEGAREKPEEPQKLSVSIADATDKKQRGQWGLTRALLSNAVEGVQEGHTTLIRFVGVGYRGTVEDEPFAPSEARVVGLDGKVLTMGKPKRLNLRLGYSHPVIMPIPPEISCTMPQPTRIVLKGTDKEAVGLFAAQIRKWRPPEPYKVSAWAGSICDRPLLQADD